MDGRGTREILPLPQELATGSYMVATGRGVIFFNDVVTVNFPTFQSITLKSTSRKQTLN